MESKITSDHGTNDIATAEDKLAGYNIYQTSNIYTLATMLKIRNPDMCGELKCSHNDIVNGFVHVGAYTRGTCSKKQASIINDAVAGIGGQINDGYVYADATVVMQTIEQIEETPLKYLTLESVAAASGEKLRKNIFKQLAELPDGAVPTIKEIIMMVVDSPDNLTLEDLLLYLDDRDA